MIKQIRAEIKLFGSTVDAKCLFISVMVLYSGILCNLLVIRLNGGMPIVGFQGDYGAYFISALNKIYVPLTETTRFSFLADIIPFGNYVASIGDILLFSGAFAVVVILITYTIRQGFRERRYLLCGKSTNMNLT